MKVLDVGSMACLLALASANPASAAGKYFEVSYPGSDRPGELKLPVKYTLWVPDGPAKLRGIIIHMHGNGAGEAGTDAAYDLQWQALAKKWECGLLGPSCDQGKSKREHDANWWMFFSSENGSRKSLHTALKEFAAKSRRSELTDIPWCLWGHSAGAMWSGLMMTWEPERIIAVWLRSQSPWDLWQRKWGTPRGDMGEEVFRIPVMCNPGKGEKDHKDHHGIWTDALAMVKGCRPKGAPVGLAPDPRTEHNCGDSRLLAIPFFDACLGMRLPDKGSKDQNLKPVDMKKAWLAEPLSDKAVPAAQYQGDPHQASWLPNESFAKKWIEYVKTGYVTDTTAPPAPTNVKAVWKADKSVELTWEAEVDFESGLRTFIIMRNEVRIGRTEPVIKSRSGTVPVDGRPLFQGLSYHDTPLQPQREMRYVDKEPPPGANLTYQVIAVNSEGLRSKPVAAKVR